MKERLRSRVDQMRKSSWDEENPEVEKEKLSERESFFSKMIIESRLQIKVEHLLKVFTNFGNKIKRKKHSKQRGSAMGLFRSQDQGCLYLETSEAYELRSLTRHIWGAAFKFGDFFSHQIRNCGKKAPCNNTTQSRSSFLEMREGSSQAIKFEDSNDPQLENIINFWPLCP